MCCRLLRKSLLVNANLEGLFGGFEGIVSGHRGGFCHGREDVR